MIKHLKKYHGLGIRLAAVVAVSGTLMAVNAARADWDNPYTYSSHDQHHEAVRTAAQRETRENVAIRDEDRRRIHDYVAREHMRRCPHGCRAPHVVYYNRGTFLPREVVYEPLPQDIYAQLAPPPPYAMYVRVDDNAYLINTATREILDGVSLLATTR